MRCDHWSCIPSKFQQHKLDNQNNKSSLINSNLECSMLSLIFASRKGLSKYGRRPLGGKTKISRKSRSKMTGNLGLLYAEVQMNRLTFFNGARKTKGEAGLESLVNLSVNLWLKIYLLKTKSVKYEPLELASSCQFLNNPAVP